MKYFFSLKLFFGSFLPSCLGIKCFLYYIYLSIYINISVCFFLIARSLDLLLSKITRKSYELFSAIFPTPSLNVEQLQLQNPHIHIFQMIPVSLGIACTMVGSGDIGKSKWGHSDSTIFYIGESLLTQQVGFLYNSAFPSPLQISDPFP